MRFSTPAEAIAAINEAFGPKNDSAWRFDRPLVLVANRAGAPPSLRTFYAATTRTMHFGAMTIDLATGETRFIDEDHRDGGDDELKRVVLPADWLDALRAVLDGANS
jgi:hypothetical protein